MDHSTANMIDFNAKNSIYSIDSNFTSNTQEEALDKGEHLMHNKRQQMHEVFYKKIADEILKYDNVLLFGPTNAKSELHNYLKKDLHFKDKKIKTESAEDITDNEKTAFVKNYFDKQSN